jgi:hypothetical protein
VAGKAHFGGKCIDAGCVDGLRIPVKMGVDLHLLGAHIPESVDHNVQGLEVVQVSRLIFKVLNRILNPASFGIDFQD